MRHVAFFACAFWCTAQLSPPVIGYVRTSASELRPVLGVAGAFVLGETLERDVLSASFTSASGLVKKEREVLFYRAGKFVSRHDAPAGIAVFSFTSRGEPAAARFENGECHEWRGGEFVPADQITCGDNASVDQVADDWLALRGENGILLKRGDRTWQLPE
jgi:hypothetical protein